MSKKQAGNAGLKSFRNLPSFRLHVLARLSERMHELHYERNFGLNLRECRIIGITGGHGESSFSRIYADSNLDRAQVSRLINRLVARGLLRKEDDPTDQRAVKVSLTERGLAVHRELHAAATALNEQWLAPLSEADRATLLGWIELLTDRTRQLSDSKPAGRKSPARSAALLRNGPAAAPARVVLDPKMASQRLDALHPALSKKRP
jgi:DNA-binding MarR family transcriptional regulator